MHRRVGRTSGPLQLKCVAEIAQTSVQALETASEVWRLPLQLSCNEALALGVYMAKQAFGLEVSVDDRTGGLVAVYLRVREGEVAETKEVQEGVAYADYDGYGVLLGLEL